MNNKVSIVRSGAMKPQSHYPSVKIPCAKILIKNKQTNKTPLEEHYDYCLSD